MSEQATVAIEGHVAHVNFVNAPLNFATIALLRAIADALEALDADQRVRAIVLTSEGKSFCAGADLASANGFGGATDDPLREFYDQALRIFAAHKPIVAAIQGAAIGAGLGLAVACDFRVAAPEARFAANFVKLGFHPGFGLTATLPRLVGEQRSALMMLTGERYKAEEVVHWGLVDRIADMSGLLHAAHALASDVAANAPLSLLATRATIRHGLLETVRAALVREHAEQMTLRPTEDHAEGVRAVAERRAGNFLGR